MAIKVWIWKASFFCGASVSDDGLLIVSISSRHTHFVDSWLAVLFHLFIMLTVSSNDRSFILAGAGLSAESGIGSCDRSCDGEFQLRVSSASSAPAYVPLAAPATAVAEIPSHNQQTNSQRTIFFPSAPGIGPSHRGDVVTHDSEASLNCLHC